MSKGTNSRAPVLQIVCDQTGIDVGLVGKSLSRVERGKHGELLGKIADQLGKKKRGTKEPPIGGILIIGAQGTFSESRSAVAIANMLAYTWSIPLAYKTKGGQLADLSQAWTFLEKSAKWPVRPKYSGEPNITIGK